MPVKHVYLKIEPVEDYSPVAPMEKAAPPIQYRRDCMYGPGHPGGVIPEAEVLGRSLTALVYREYADEDFLIPVAKKLVSADVNEPIWSRRVPGTVIYAHPGDTLRITVLNGDVEPHSLHVHGLEYGADSDGAWPFGTRAADGRRSDEICPGERWTYTFRVTKESIGAWPFHDHSSHHPSASIDRGLFGGIVVLPKKEPEPPHLVLPPRILELLERLRALLPSKPWLRRPGPPISPGLAHGHRPPDPFHFLPGAVRSPVDLGELRRPVPDVVRPHGRSGHPGAPPPHAGRGAVGGHGGEGPGGGAPGAGERGTPHGPGHPPTHPPAAAVHLALRQHFDLLDEWLLHELVRPEIVFPAKPARVLHVPLFLHVMRDHRMTPAFDSGDLEELTAVYELSFPEVGEFGYFCRYHPLMQGTVEVVSGGPAAATVNIVDAPEMSFSPEVVTIGPGGTVRWENLSIQHHTVTSTDGASMATHCLNGRGFVGNSPTIVARTGQRIRWYVFNLDVGEMWHNFHPHNSKWRFADETIDVRSIGPAESFVVETVAPPVVLLEGAMADAQDPDKRPKGAKRFHLASDYLFHCHVHHHMMNGMVGLIRARQTVWLTDAMAEELEATQGVPVDTGSNACPDVDPHHCMPTGRWEQVEGDPEVTFMHSMLVPGTDKVLYWGYTRADQTRLWDHGTAVGSYSAPANQPADVVGDPSPVSSSDLWSAEHEHLDTDPPAILANGGFTPNKAFVFDAQSLSWSRVQDSEHDRFYSSTFSLDDGRIITMFGSWSKSFELYEHGVGWSPPIAVPPDFNIYQYYPWAFLLPDGRVFIAGPQNPTRRFDPLAPVSDPAETFATLHGQTRSGGGENGTAVLLPLRPPDYRPRVVIAGGNFPALLKSAEIIDLSQPVPAWEPLPDMHHARGNLTGVLLPTGQVFVAGGVFGEPDGGPAEILSAEDGAPAWQLGPRMTYPRAYHSSMLMLADGSVLAGGDPGGVGGPTPHERFFPWYADLPRPTITGAPTQIDYGESFTIDTPEAADVAEVVVMRPGAVTHGFNMTQRAVELVITGQAGGTVDVEAPPDGRIAPPGPYLLFVRSSSGAPSEGRWIRLTT